MLAVSFGTSFEETREKTIGAIERRLAERFPVHRVCRCFTSGMIRRKLLERDGIRIDSPEEVLQRAVEEGVRDLTVQPLYLTRGKEHRRLMETLDRYRDCFEIMTVGEPLLSGERDFHLLAEAAVRHLSLPDEDTVVVLMGHGTPVREENAVYGRMQEALRAAGGGRYYIATVEGVPVLRDILPQILDDGYKKVILAPFMIVAGDHALHDLAGEGPDSWKSLLEGKGLPTEAVLRGIGEWKEVRDLFADHALVAAGSGTAGSR